MRFSEAILTKFSGHEKASFLIAAFPNEETKKKLKEYQDSIDSKGATKTLPPEELHCTIRFIKKAEYDKEEDLIKALKDIKEKLKLPIKAKVEKVENLGDKDAFVLLLESEEMHKSFDVIDKSIRDAGAPKSNYDSFTAHTTLFYDVKAEGKKVPDFELVFDKIKLRDNTDKVLWEITL